MQDSVFIVDSALRDVWKDDFMIIFKFAMENSVPKC